MSYDAEKLRSIRKSHKPIKQKFFAKDGGMFLTQQEALEASDIRKPGKQNKRRQTLWRKKQRIVNASRKKNRHGA